MGFAFDMGRTNSGDIMSPERDWYGPQFFDSRSLKKMQRYISEKGSCLSPFKGKKPKFPQVDLSKTCHSGFNGVLPLNKKTFKIGNLNFKFDEGVTSVGVYYLQWELAIYVFLVAKNGYHILQYKRMPAMKKLKSNRIGDWVSFGINSSPRARTIWSWSEIGRSSSMETCCWNRLFIHLLIKLCNNNAAQTQCTTSFKVFEVFILC